MSPTTTNRLQRTDSWTREVGCFPVSSLRGQPRALNEMTLGCHIVTSSCVVCYMPWYRCSRAASHHILGYGHGAPWQYSGGVFVDDICEGNFEKWKNG